MHSNDTAPRAPEPLARSNNRRSTAPHQGRINMRLLIAFAAATMLFASVAKAGNHSHSDGNGSGPPATSRNCCRNSRKHRASMWRSRAISYIDMHSKLVPQLISPEGSYDLIVVDFYWVGEFTKAGWLMPLDDLATRRQCRCRRVRPQAHGLGRACRRHALHAAVLQLFDGRDLSPGSDRRSRGTGGLQGEIRNRSQGSRDLGRNTGSRSNSSRATTTATASATFTEP